MMSKSKTSKKFRDQALIKEAHGAIDLCLATLLTPVEPLNDCRNDTLMSVDEVRICIRYDGDRKKWSVELGARHGETGTHAAGTLLEALKGAALELANEYWEEVCSGEADVKWCRGASKLLRAFSKGKAPAMKTGKQKQDGKGKSSQTRDAFAGGRDAHPTRE